MHRSTSFPKMNSANLKHFTFYVTPCQCFHASLKIEISIWDYQTNIENLQQISKSLEGLTNWWSITGMFSKSEFIALGRLKCIKICLLQVSPNLECIGEISFVTAELLLYSWNLIWNQEISSESIEKTSVICEKYSKIWKFKLWLFEILSNST